MTASFVQGPALASRSWLKLVISSKGFIEAFALFVSNEAIEVKMLLTRPLEARIPLKMPAPSLTLSKCGSRPQIARSEYP